MDFYGRTVSGTVCVFEFGAKKIRVLNESLVDVLVAACASSLTAPCTKTKAQHLNVLADLILLLNVVQ
jgi:hypothetical protein